MNKSINPSAAVGVIDRGAVNSEMKNSSNEAIDIVKRFLDAWAHQDFDGVIASFDESATFHASVGPGPGQAYIGRDQIAPAVKSMFEKTIGIEFDVTELIPFEGGVVATWCVTSRGTNNEVVKSPGIDVFRVRDGKVILKDAYRKLKA